MIKYIVGFEDKSIMESTYNFGGIVNLVKFYKDNGMGRGLVLTALILGFAVVAIKSYSSNVSDDFSAIRIEIEGIADEDRDDVDVHTPSIDAEYTVEE